MAGALHNPNGITIHSNNPLLVLNPVLYVSSASTRMLLYPARMSNLLNNDFPRSSSRIEDIFGSGVTARIEVPRESTTQVTNVIGIPANGDRGIISGEEGLRPRVLVITEESSIGGGQGLLVVGRGRGTQQHTGEEERVEG